MASRLSGKRVISLIALPNDLPDKAVERLRNVQREDQGFNIANAIVDQRFNPDLVKNTDAIIAGFRAGGALTKVGLDPEAFEINRDKLPAPFPGLESFNDSDADAAIFYGRSDDIAFCLEELRKMRANLDRRSLAIVGSSGSGKSSLLKAGVLPRLRRETGWIALRSFRPGVDALVSFAESWSKSYASLGVTVTSADILARITSVWKPNTEHEGEVDSSRLAGLREVLDELAQRIRLAAGRLDATVLITLDQAEELLYSDRRETDIVCDCLRAILLDAQDEKNSYPWATALTIRADYFADLQKNARFVGLAVRGVDIRSVESYRVDDIVECPAARYGVKVSPNLLSLLLKESGGSDAIPLLAFALRQLWEGIGQENQLGPAAYEKVRGIAGLIEIAAERALRGVGPLENVARPISIERENLARAVFIPGLISINEQGAPTKRVTATHMLSDVSKTLLNDFIVWRLVVRKRAPEPVGDTVELAHDAILRSWPRLESWIKPEAGRLETLRLLDQSAALWHRRDHSPSLLVHSGKSLDEAIALTREPRFSSQLSSAQREYIVAAAKRQRRRRVTITSVLALICCALFCTAALLTSLDQSRELERGASVYMKFGDPKNAVPLAVAAVPEQSQLVRYFAPNIATDTLKGTGFQLPILFEADKLYQLNHTIRSDDSKWFVYQTDNWGGRIVSAIDGHVARKYDDGDFQGGGFSSDSKYAVLRTRDNDLEGFDLAKEALVPTKVKVTGASDANYGYDPVPKTSKFVIAVQDGDISLWDLAKDQVQGLGVQTQEMTKWVIGSDTSRLLIVSRGQKCVLWDAATLQDLVHMSDCNFAQMSKNGQVVVSQSDLSIHFWNQRTGMVVSPPPLKIRPRLIGLSSKGTYVGMNFPDGHGEVWSTLTGQIIADFCGKATDTFEFSPDETRLLVLNNDNSASLCDVRTNREIGDPYPSGTVAEHAFTKDGHAMSLISNDSHAKVIDTQTGEVITNFDGEPVNQSYFTPDSHQVFTDSSSGAEALWDLETKAKTDLTGEGGISDISYSSDGFRAVINGEQDRGMVWDVKRGQKIADIGAAVSSFVLFPNGERLLLSPAGTNSNAILLELPKERIPNLAGADLRHAVCTANSRQIGLFTPTKVNEIKKVIGPSAGAAIEGLPWNPCDWRGLLEPEGWAQFLRRQAVRWFDVGSYQCGEVSAFGRIDPNAFDQCRREEEVNTEALNKSK